MVQLKSGLMVNHGTQQQPNRIWLPRIQGDSWVSALFGCFYFAKTQEPGTCWERSCFAKTVREEKPTDRKGNGGERPGFVIRPGIWFQGIPEALPQWQFLHAWASTCFYYVIAQELIIDWEVFPRTCTVLQHPLWLLSSLMLVHSLFLWEKSWFFALWRLSWVFSYSAFGILKFYSVSRCYYI